VSVTIGTTTVDRGYGGAFDAARDLLDGGADVVVANVSAPVAQRLAPLFAERHASLVVANAGAHVVLPGDRSPFVLHNSLLYWHASYALGQWAAAHLGRTAFVATSLSDAGYDTVYAFKRGFESVGGPVVGDAVTHADPADAGLSELFTAAQSTGANVLCGLYSGAHAAEFVQAYAGSSIGAKLVVGSLAVEDFQLASVGRAALGAVSCASWTATRRTAANQAFTKAFRSRYGRRADPFAALGYDTALLIAQGARRAVKRGMGLRRLIEALGGASVVGPRGTLWVDRTTNTVVGKLFVRRVRKTPNGLANVDLAEVGVIRSFPDAVAPLAGGPRSGYVNEYLCAS
jgi:branched-chain amino acid transport system substrate-binding protein